MAKTYQAPLFVRLGNVLTTTLLRAGVKLVGTIPCTCSRCVAAKAGSHIRPQS
jgi:hypothetical protein